MTRPILGGSYPIVIPPMAGHPGLRDAEFYYQLVKWVSRLEAEASVDHAGMERANAHLYATRVLVGVDS